MKLDLDLVGISKRVGGRSGPRVLDGLDLRVEGATAMVLLGESGAGKTTLLRIIAGLTHADAGRVELGGQVLSNPGVVVPPRERGVGMVFQELELWPHMTVAEHLGFALPSRPKKRAALESPAVCTLAESVGLDSRLLARRPEALSGGERQRVAIGRSLAAKPRVLLFDEPLASLDPRRRSALRLLIRQVVENHQTTVVYVTHDAEDALELGDRVAILADGNVAAVDTPHALYRNPTSLRVARALGPVTALRASVQGDRIHTALGTFDGTGSATTRWGQTHGQPLLALVRPEHIELVHTPNRDDRTATVYPIRSTPARHGWRVTALSHVVDGAAERCTFFTEDNLPADGSSVAVRLTTRPTLVLAQPGDGPVALDHATRDTKNDVRDEELTVGR